MRHAKIAALGVALMLGGCQTYTYQRIGAGPTLEYAKAKCDMLAGSVDQGYFAYGSTSYVAGAALGNALGNAIREDRFEKNCMVMQGWARVPVSSGSASADPAIATAQARARAVSPAVGGKGAGKFPPPPKP